MLISSRKMMHLVYFKSSLMHMAVEKRHHKLVVWSEKQPIIGLKQKR